MRHIAAHYVFTGIGNPIPMGVITLNDEHVITEIGVLTDETESTEFYNGILTSGFINAHCHLELSYLRNQLKPCVELADFIGQMTKIPRRPPAANEALAAMCAADAEMQREGIVAVGDICNTAGSFPLKRRSAIYYHSFIEAVGLDEIAAAAAMQRLRQLCADAQQAGLPASITPHAAYSLSDALLDAAMDAANRAGILSVHNQECDTENELFTAGRGALHDLFAAAGFPLPPVTGQRAIYRLLPRIAPSVRALFVHNVALSEDDYDRATDRLPHLTWVLCPNSNRHIGQAVPPVDLLYRKNARIAIGTDSLASNSRLSVLEELKSISRRFPHIPLQTLLQWATVNGAAALGKEREWGCLRTGANAGIVLIENVNLHNLCLTADSRARPLVLSVKRDTCLRDENR
ncbi:MAG: amidohydrolase family protein [Prevotellaceae bacterium]|jgi:cytosine/adenosine deaminase-related metal-dependent hydrolase|nr:amidohydrolase family protein [Prevotellaceae bacterium]